MEMFFYHFTFPKTIKSSQKFSGLTLIELLVVLAILAILILAALFAFRYQLAKGRDGKRKADLAKMQNCFEDYLSDKRRYPAPGEVSDDSDPYGGRVCRQSFLPCLAQLPCDPINNDLYNYRYQTNASRSWYKIYAKLENPNDPVIASLGCTNGCGSGNNYSYWVSSPNVIPCVPPNVEAYDGWCNPDLPCQRCPADKVCLPQGDCCRPVVGDECRRQQ